MGISNTIEDNSNVNTAYSEIEITSYHLTPQIDDGISICEKAVELCEDPIAKSKALLLLATGYSYKLAECRVRSSRELLEKNAYNAYNKYLFSNSVSISFALLLLKFFILNRSLRCYAIQSEIIYYLCVPTYQIL